MAKASRSRDGETDNNAEQFENGGATRTEQITIAGQTFNVPSPFEEGHLLTAGEASQLNQVYHENIRNNFSKRVKEGKATQADIDAYAASYKMGVRTGGGGRTGDPVRREAIRLAKDDVLAAIRKRGDKVSDYAAADISAKATKLVDERPRYMEEARENVEKAARRAAEVEE